MKGTGFKDSYGHELFIDDIVAHHNGYDGYFKVTEKDSKFFLTEITPEIFGDDSYEDLREFELESDLLGHYSKVGEEGKL